MSAEVLSALRMAREILSGRSTWAGFPTGWEQGSAFILHNWDDGPQICLCLNAAVALASRTARVYDAAMHALQLALPGDRWTVSGYNDYARDLSQITDLIGRAMLLVQKAAA